MLKSLLKVAALSAIVLGSAANAQAQSEKLYLCDVATEEELNADVFGVPMACDIVGEGLYEARYYNAKANTEIFFLTDKTSFDGAWGLFDGEFMTAPIAMMDPIVLPEAGKYYLFKIDLNENTYSMETYEVADYMDPVIWDLHSDNLNQWFAYVDTGTDDYIPTDDAWMREFYFGYSTGPTNVISFVQDANNKHLYSLEAPVHFDAGERLDFMIHNYHDAGWWNFVTWRVDDPEECDVFHYYGGIVKKAYLDWWFKQDVDWQQWKNGEDYRKQIIYGGGNDHWCNPTVQVAGDYNLVFDSHLGRGKLVPASWVETGVNSAMVDQNLNAPVEYYNLQGMRMQEPKAGQVVIVKQGNKISKRVF